MQYLYAYSIYMNILNSFSRPTPPQKIINDILTITGLQVIPLNNPADNNSIATGTFNVSTQTSYPILNGIYTTSSSTGDAASGFKTDAYCDLVNFKQQLPAQFNYYSAYTLDSGTGGYIPSSISTKSMYHSTYNGSNSILVNQTQYQGEWLKIQFPFRFVPKKYGLYVHPWGDRRIATHTFLGSTDGANWTVLRNTDNNVINGNSNNENTYNLIIFNITTSNMYKYYAVVINKVARSDGNANPQVVASTRLYVFS